jgi:hypothetical protein
LFGLDGRFLTVQTFIPLPLLAITLLKKAGNGWTHDFSFASPDLQ